MATAPVLDAMPPISERHESLKERAPSCLKAGSEFVDIDAVLLAKRASTSSQSPPSAGRIVLIRAVSGERVQGALRHRVDGERTRQRFDIEDGRGRGLSCRCWPRADAAGALQRCKCVAAGEANRARGASVGPLGDGDP